MFFGANDDRIRTPRTEGGEPQVPVKARLVRRVNTGRLGGVLRLKAKRIDQPGFTIGGALELNLVTPAGHYREKAVAIGDTERFERRHWRGREGIPGLIIQMSCTVDA